MGEPSVQAIERILPAQHKKLAADIHRRLVRGDRRDADGDSGNDGAATAATAASATAPVTSGEDAGRASWAVDETAAAPVAAPAGHSGPAPSPQARAAPAQSGAPPAHQVPVPVPPGQAPAGPATEPAPAPQPRQEPEVKVSPLVAKFNGLMNGGIGGGSVMDPGDRVELNNTHFDQYEFGASSVTGAEGIKVRHRGKGEGAKIEVT